MVSRTPLLLMLITAPYGVAQTVTASSARAAQVEYSTSKPHFQSDSYDLDAESTSADTSFRWKPALAQAGKFLAIQHGTMFANDKWTRYNTRHGKYLHDWGNGVQGTFATWDDGDPFLDNYVGHPLQGAIIGYVQVQNDPKNVAVEFSWSKRYWASRMKATAFNAAYSTQFEIGPISEAAFANLGAFPYQNCPTCKMTKGAGWVDLVMTPAGGLGWMVMEDALDRYVVRRSERGGPNGGWNKFLRTALNPSRTVANILAGKKPWFRVRDQSATFAGSMVTEPRRLEAQQISEAARGRQH
jgi:hypothetical protein